MPFTQGCSRSVSNLVLIGTLVLVKKILNFMNVFSLLRNYLPLEKGVALHLNILESFFIHGCIVPSLFEIGTVVLEMRILKFRQCILFRNYLPLEKDIPLL